MLRLLRKFLGEDGQPPFTREEILGGLSAIGALIAINAFVGLIELLVR